MIKVALGIHTLAGIPGTQYALSRIAYCVPAIGL
jgi:hypothetical protein